MKNKYLVIIFFLLIFNSLNGEEHYTIPVEDSPFIGPENAIITMVEFLDYQ